MFPNVYLLEPKQEEEYKKQVEYISNLSKELKSIPYENKTSYVYDKLYFVRTFNSKGVQGIVGLLKIPSIKTPLVFKISVDINKSIEHENIVMNECNELRKIVPHYVRCIGMIELPISEDFIRKPYEYGLFETGGDLIPRNILFVEYVYKLPFYKLCDRIISRCETTEETNLGKNIVISQMLQVLMSIYTGQKYKKFVHYDLHTANILIQKCDVNTHFLYITENNSYLIPTYGFFPVLIDYGFSYVDELRGKKMFFNTDNYNWGYQTSEYDPLQDVHRFLINCLYSLEDEHRSYYHITNKIKYIFRNIPVLRKSGWKKLPYDFTDIILDNIKDQCSDYSSYTIFRNCKKECLEILNGLVSIPFNKTDDNYDFADCFPYFMEEYQKIIDIDYYSDNDCMFVLKIIVDLIITRDLTTFEHDLNFIIKKVLDINIPEKGVNYKKLYLSLVVFGERLENFYSYLIKKNNIIIEKSYDNTIIKNVEDVFIYLFKNVSPYTEVKYNDKIFVWDTRKSGKNQTITITPEKYSENVLKQINTSPVMERGKYLL